MLQSACNDASLHPLLWYVLPEAPAVARRLMRLLKAADMHG